MSKFHSTVSRREFMKGLGLAGAGLGGAAAVAPVFHDLDELMSSADVQQKRAWWIKEVDEPTVDIDWNLMARHHGFHSTQSGIILARYTGGGAEYAAIKAKSKAANTAGLKANTPGLNLRDQALSAAGRGVRISGRNDSIDGVNRDSVKTPEELGVPRWEGTPEENFKILRAAMVFYGASNIGTGELTEHQKKLVGLYGDNINESYLPPKWPPPTTVTAPVNFASQPTFSFDAATRTTTIPDSIPIYTCSYTIPQSNEMWRTSPESFIMAAANSARYRLRENVRACTQAFIKALGYTSLHDEPYRAVPSIAGATLSGLTENSRHTIMGISPEHGSTVGLYELMTTLPLPHTKPIDAGIWRFCQSCGVCAEHCPSDSIVKKGDAEPSYTPPPSAITPKLPPFPGLGFDPMGAGEAEYFKLGRKTYWTDMVSCRLYNDSIANRCTLCFGVCTFNAENRAMVHEIIRSTTATTSLFNGFFASMHAAFGLGLKELDEKEQWWDMELPAYGYSTVRTSSTGGL